MTAQELLSALEAREVSLAVRGEQLRIEAPHGVLTEELRRTLRERKAELVRPHEMRLLNEVKTLFGQTIVSVKPRGTHR